MTTFDRRQFLQRGSLLGATAFTGLGLGAGLVPAWAQNAPDLGTPTLPAPGHARLKVGDVEVLAINDGVTRRPLGEEFVRNAPLAEVRALLASQGLPTTHIDVPYTPFVVLAGGRRILIDAGLGDMAGTTTGRLLQNLHAAGLQPGDIDTVLISHFHGDHIHGLRSKAGTWNFPNAKVWVPAPERAFWMDDARMNAAPEAMKGAFMAVRRVFGGLPADRLVAFEPGSELLPGLRSIPAYGHTPGHTLFELQSAGQRFMYLADLTNVPALFARNPDWAVVFDMDPEAARQVRRRVFASLTDGAVTAGGFHFPFPAFGRIARAGEGYAFQPA